MQKIFKSCCGCCSLRFGVIIIGTLDLVQRFLLFISLTMTRNFTSLLIAILIETALATIPAILLLVGAIKYKKWCLLPWLVETALHCIIIAVAMALVPIFSPFVTSLFIKDSQKNNNVLNALGIISIIFSVEVVSFISIGLDVYIFLVVLSFLNELLAEDERGIDVIRK